MERAIVAFRSDEAGHWIADLDCLHSQHVRHQPPFRLAPWVMDEAERARRVGSALDCPLCDRAELPEDLRVVRTTATWDERTMPDGLRRAHRIGSGVWARLRVERGWLRFQACTSPALDVLVGPGDAQAIPPEVEHHVAPQGAVSFSVEFLQR